MIRTAVLIICFSICTSLRTYGQSVFSTRDSSLQESTIISPDDLLRNIPEWNLSTTDGFTYSVNADNYGFYGPQPAIYVNDIPVDISFLGWQNINMLPVSVEDISSLTYDSQPQIYNEHLAAAGYLNLHTAPPDTGLSVSSSIGLINKIEDPGPWVYNAAKVTPNVDRWGFNVSSRISYNKSGWLTKTSFSYREHQPTTLINYPRNAVYYPVDGKWYAIKTRIFNGLGEVGYTYKKWNIRARFIQSDNIDFIFFHPFGREIPANPFYRQYALQSSYQLKDWVFKARYLGDLKSLKYQLNKKRYDLDWSQFNHTFSVSGSYQKPDIQIKAGAIYESGITKTSAIGHYHKSMLSVFGNLDKRWGPDYWLSPSFNLDFTGEEVAPTISLESQYNITPIWQLSLGINYAELIPYKQENSSYWIKRGYSLFSNLSISSQAPLSSHNNRLFSIKIKNKFTLNSNVNFQFTGRYVKNIALNIPWQTFTYNSKVATTPGNFEYTSESGNRLVFNLALTHIISKSFTQRVSGKVQHTTYGSERYRRYWDQVPDYTFNYKISFQPVSDLLLSTEATFRNSAKWWEFQDLDGEKYYSVERLYRQQTGIFHSRNPQYFDINLNAKKWFWDRKLRTTFSVRNLLNTKIQSHPLGTDLKLRFMVKATLQL